MSLAIKSSKARAGNIGRGIGGPAVASARANVNAFPGLQRAGFQGDPGLFGFLGKAAGFLGSAITGGAAGVIGSIAGAITQQQAPPAGPGSVSFPTSGGFFPTVGLIQQTPGTGMQKTPGVGAFFERLVPGGETGFSPGGGCAVGFHPNKSDYFLKDGTFIQKGTLCVRNRRRNPLNPRAASRAIGRIEAAKKATSRLDRISIKCRRCGTVKCGCR